MSNIPDNMDAWDRYDDERSEELDRLPVCDNCENPIQEEKFFYYRGDKICRECMETHFEVWTEDYIED